MDINDIVIELNRQVSPSGSEAEIAQIIQTIASPYADEIITDVMGNLIVHKKGNGKKIMFSAHMDSIGMIVTYIDDKGFIRFHGLGGLSPAIILSTPVRFANGVRGVISKDGDAKIDGLKMTDLYIDIGASSGEDAKKLVNIADVAVFDTPNFVNGDIFVSPYLDNRVSCAVLLAALPMLKKTDNDLYFVFSTQEEVGTRGASVAAFGVQPDIGIAVDVTRTGDTPECPVMECAIGKGAAIKIMDSSVISTPEIVKELERIAAERGIRTQREVLTSGGTDAGAMQRSRGGVKAGCISIPTRYIHTPQELCSISDANASAALVAAFAELA